MSYNSIIQRISSFLQAAFYTEYVHLQLEVTKEQCLMLKQVMICLQTQKACNNYSSITISLLHSMYVMCMLCNSCVLK
jgi:hypothetical protein